jgi:hypothetical protein
MKIKNYVFIPFLLTILISAFFAGSQVKPAFAQEQCVDAAGGPIPCPPTEDIPCGQAGGPACPPSDNGNNNDDNKRSTATPIPPTATPTNTPLPISAAPTSLPDENYLGSCTNSNDNVFDCFEKFKCEEGLLVIEIDLYADGGTKYDFYCIPDENVPQLNLPLTIPDPVGKDNNWTGGCNNDGGNQSLNIDACLDLAASDCREQGGEVSIWYDDEGAGVYCQNQSEASQPAPDATALPLAVAPPTGDTSGESWDESCSWASCWAYDLTCWSSGGSGYGVEDSAGNTGYHCDLPDSSTTGQNNLKQLALGVIVGIVLIGLLVPAINKVRDAAAKGRSARMLNNKNPELVKSQDDGAMEGGTPPPPPPPPPPPSNSSDLETWRANYGPSSQNKPKPKPKPSKGDFNSDGDVDGRDFNP